MIASQSMTSRTVPLTRAAIRFLLRHRAGVIEALDPATGRGLRARVHYEPRVDGVFVAYAALGEPLADAIAAGAAVSFTVDASTGPVRGPERDESDLPTEHAVAAVTALIDARVVELRESHIGHLAQRVAVLRFRVTDLEVLLRSGSERPAA